MTSKLLRLNSSLKISLMFKLTISLKPSLIICHNSKSTNSIKFQVALLLVSNHSKAPLLIYNHSKAPLLDNNHSKVPLLVNNHSKALLLVNNHSKVPLLETSSNFKLVKPKNGHRQWLLQSKTSLQDKL
jgi:hypothetical protein